MPNTTLSRLRSVEDPLALLESMFALTPVPYLLFGADGHPIASNAAFREMFASEPPPEYDVLRDETSARLGFATSFERAVAGKAVQIPAAWYDPRDLNLVSRPDAKPVAIECNFVPLCDRDGRVAYVAASYRDVTADLEARERAEKSEEQLRGMLEAADVGTWEWNVVENHVRWSPNLERISFLAHGTFEGTYEAWLELVHPADRTRMHAIVARMLETLEPYSAEYRVFRPEGGTAWQSARGFVIKQEAGKPKVVGGVVVDVSARHAAEEALKMPEHVLEHMTEAVTLSDERGFLKYTNPAADRMFGYAWGELLGQHVAVLSAYPREENERRGVQLLEQLRAKGEWIGEWTNQRKDGSLLITRARVTRLTLEGSRHLLCVQEDISEEVTARRHADALAENLHARERQLRLITDALPALVMYISPDRCFRFANDAFLSWFGVQPQSLLGKPVRDLFGDTAYQQIEPYIDRVLAGERLKYEQEVTLPDGRSLYGQVNCVPDKDEQGNTQGYVALVLDIADRHRAELELQAERKRLHDILLHAPAAISLRSGSDGVFTFVNAYFERLAGGSSLLGKTTREAFPESECARFMDLIDRVYQTGAPASGTEVPARARTSDGSGAQQFLNITYQPLFDAEGRVDSVVSFAVDVTGQVEARKRSEGLTAALRESEARYRSFVNQSTEGIWRIELDQPFEVDAVPAEQLAALYRDAYLAECNDAMARMYGYERADQLVGRRLRDLLVPEGPLNAEYLRAFIANGYRREGIESQKAGSGGRSRAFRSSLVGVVEKGRLRRAWGTQRDVATEVEAREQAEAGNRAKDEFLALLGHELRNPLSPILTALELMKMGDADAFPKERAIIERQVKHVVRLVDDLLDVSRITRGKISLERRRVDLANVVANAIELSSPLLEQRTHRIAVDLPPGMVVDGDPLRLAQVFANLLTNAAKYTPRGGQITIEGRRTADGRGRVCVRDTGIGIRPEMLPKIFSQFVQERQALDRAEGGLGLGLSIVRSIVELHGGEVEARSEGVGRGSEFSVYLKLVENELPQPEPTRPREGQPARPSGLRVLVVDDNEDAAALLAKVLRDWGEVVHVAHDGPAALKLVERFTPDMALLDIGLPAMDGYELARRLRAMPALARLRLVAVTGYGQTRDREAAKQAGFHEHMVKPVNLSELASVLSRTAQPFSLASAAR